MNAHLFGTDGIRSRFGTPPLDEISIIRLGKALTEIFSNHRFLIGHDTRESGSVIEDLLCRSLGARADIFLAGMVPTPAISYLTRKGGYDGGIMISASHNPAEENGIKLFNRFGEKFSLRAEREIEARFTQTRSSQLPKRHCRRPSSIDGHGQYLQYLIGLSRNISGRLPKMVVDGANGAASFLARDLLKSIGARASFIHCRPDGNNINRKCGSTDTQNLREKVLHEHAEMGVAFDGDADRVVFIDKLGNLLEGDHTLFILASHFLAAMPRFPKTVVGTVMNNLGLEQALVRMGIEFVRTDVGDRSVYRELKKRKAWLGGEPSGHTILRQFQPSGDGLLVTLTLLSALHFSDERPYDCFRRLTLYPQKVLSLPVKRKKELRSWQNLQRLIKEFDCQGGTFSRILVRYSGTEQKIRIMIESKEASIIDLYMDRFAALVRSEIGG